MILRDPGDEVPRCCETCRYLYLPCATIEDTARCVECQADPRGLLPLYVPVSHYLRSR